MASSGPVDHQNDKSKGTGQPSEGLSREAVADELASALAELDALERAVEELPQVLEDKFRQRVRALAEFNRQLALQQQMLQKGDTAGLTVASEPPRRLPALPWPRLHLLPSLPLRMVLLAFACSAMGLLGWGLAQRLQAPLRVAPAPPVVAPRLNSAGTLTLRASGPSWVEVQDLVSREVLLVGVLATGEQRQIRLRQGLRLRSGRPDLLTLQIDGQGPQPMGANLGTAWRKLLPPEVPKKVGA